LIKLKIGPDVGAFPVDTSTDIFEERQPGELRGGFKQAETAGWHWL
jgi:hypothetical protein